MPMATGREHYGGNTAAEVGKLSKRGRNAAERPCARWFAKNAMRSRKAMLIGWCTAEAKLTSTTCQERKKEKKKKGDARHRSLSHTVLLKRDTKIQQYMNLNLSDKTLS